MQDGPEDKTCTPTRIATKGSYPLGDIGVIGGRIVHRRAILPPILSSITLWVWPI